MHNQVNGEVINHNGIETTKRWRDGASGAQEYPVVSREICNPSCNSFAAEGLFCMSGWLSCYSLRGVRKKNTNRDANPIPDAFGCHYLRRFVLDMGNRNNIIILKSERTCSSGISLALAISKIF